MHTNLGQALGRQPRLNRVGQSILNIGGDASAAYSLRSLTGGEPKAVRIRRGGDNEERDFTTAEIGTEAADWTNGLQETALPADLGVTSFTQSSLAYGLQSVGVSLSGGSSLDDFDGTFTPNSDGTVWSNGSNLGVNYAFGAGSWVLNFADGSNSGSISISSTAKYPFQVTNWASASVSIGTGASGLDNSTWNTAASYQSFTPIYGATTTYPTAEAAYSLRKVRSTYTGPAVRIRRESDDIDADVAFDTNDTVSNDSIVTEVLSGNQSTLQAFISGTNAAVAIWYDQSGSSKNATQTTDDNQPLIAESGSLHTDDGKPALKFNGTSHRLDLSAKARIENTSIFSAFRSNNNTQDTVLFHFAVNASNAVSIGFGGATGTLSSSLGSRLRVGASNLVSVGDNTFTSTSQSLLSYIASSSAAKMFVDSTEETDSVAARSSGPNNRIGARGDDARFFDGDISEVILFDSDQTNNRFKIESNINNHYTIYTAAQNSFVNKWYDQSGNSKNATASADADEPEIVKNGNLLTDSGGRPEIQFDGSSHHFNVNFGSDLNQPNTIVMVHQSDTTTLTKNEFFDREGTSDNPRTLLDQVTTNYRMLSAAAGDTGVALDTNKNLIVALYNGASSVLTKNGTASSVFNSGTLGINQRSEIGRSDGSSGNYDGTMQEFIVYNANQSSVQTALETNIKNHYGIS